MFEEFWSQHLGKGRLEIGQQSLQFSNHFIRRVESGMCMVGWLSDPLVFGRLSKFPNKIAKVTVEE